MVLDSYELEQIADDLYKDRKIKGSVYCSDCGYNLRTLPYIYTCPECGNQYNARPLSMQGIFAPQEIEFPFHDILGAATCVIATVLLTMKGIESRAIAYAVLVIPLGLLSIWSVWRMRTRFQRYAKALEISRRVAEQEAED